MKEDKKTTYKEDMIAYAFITVVLLIIGFVVGLIIESIKDREITYEYAKNCEIGRSDNCYVDNNDLATCIVDGDIIHVDNYYEVEK